MSNDPRILYHPLRDWKREAVMVKDDEKKILFKLQKRYRLTHKGETMLECRTLKEIDAYLKAKGLRGSNK